MGRVHLLLSILKILREHTKRSANTSGGVASRPTPAVSELQKLQQQLQAMTQQNQLLQQQLQESQMYQQQLDQQLQQKGVK